MVACRWWTLVLMQDQMSIASSRNFISVWVTQGTASGQCYILIYITGIFLFCTMRCVGLLKYFLAQEFSGLPKYFHAQEFPCPRHFLPDHAVPAVSMILMKACSGWLHCSSAVQGMRVLKAMVKGDASNKDALRVRGGLDFFLKMLVQQRCACCLCMSYLILKIMQQQSRCHPVLYFLSSGYSSDSRGVCMLPLSVEFQDFWSTKVCALSLFEPFHWGNFDCLQSLQDEGHVFFLRAVLLKTYCFPLNRLAKDLEPVDERVQSSSLSFFPHDLRPAEVSPWPPSLSLCRSFGRQRYVGFSFCIPNSLNLGSTAKHTQSASFPSFTEVLASKSALPTCTSDHLGNLASRAPRNNKVHTRNETWTIIHSCDMCKGKSETRISKRYSKGSQMQDIPGK